MKSHLTFKKYYQTHFKHIYLSKFIIKNNKYISRITTTKCAIQSKKLGATQFLFLFLLTRKLPVVKKNYKNTLPFKKTNRFTGQRKSFKIEIFFKKRHKWWLLYWALTNIFHTQNTIESNIFQLTSYQISMFIENTPLLYGTTKLQSQHQYVALLPVEFNINLKYTSLFEKLYLFMSLRFLKKISYLPGLWNLKI